MARQERLYVRLSRPVAGLASYSSLWRGPDHLLLATSIGYREQYQRFNFGDIQAFLITGSGRREYWTIAFGGVIALLLLRVLVAWSGGEVPWIALSLIALCGILIGVNYLKGPTCKVMLVTRVRTVRLPLRRRRKTEQVLAELRPLIEAAQADLTVPLAPPSLAHPPA